MNQIRIPLIKSTFYKEEETKERLIKFIRDAGKLSFGEKCVEFEKELSKFQQRKYAVVFNSGSSANLALLQALLSLGRIEPADRVGFSALTWSTNVMPIIQLGLKPLPVDVEVETLNVSSRTLLEALESGVTVKALFITNLLGFCSDLTRIRSLCLERGILLIEDNCESFGSTHSGSKLGNFGLASTLSFYVGHHMSTIEGGAVCTDDEELAVMLQMVRAHGWDRNLEPRHQEAVRQKHGVENEFYARYSFYTLGYNFRPTEITGFLGLDQLKYMEEIIKKRNLNFLKFYGAAKDNFDFHRATFDHMDFVSNFAFPVICKSPKILASYLRRFQEAGVEVRPVVTGDITQQPFYKKLFGETPVLPNARLVHNQGFYFGNHPELTEDEVSLLAKLLTREENGSYSASISAQRLGLEYESE